MNINIPPDSRDWLFASGPADEGGLWSLGRYPPPCEVGDEIVFRFDALPVARARVHLLLPPGDHDGPAHHGRRYLSGHKVVWLWAEFVDLRGTDEQRYRVAADDLTPAMRGFLKEAAAHEFAPLGHLGAGTLRGLLRRGLVRELSDGRAYITTAGKWAAGLDSLRQSPHELHGPRDPELFE